MTAARAVAASVALVCAASACAGASSPRPAPGGRTIVLGLAPPRMPVIVGGTAAQRTLLGRIVRGLRPAQITRLAIRPVPAAWRPRPGDVRLIATLAGLARTRRNLVGDWESLVIGGAFRDRSAVLGLPRVLVVGNDAMQGRFTGGPHPPAQRPSGIPAFRRRVIAVTRTPGARLLAVRVGVPDGYTAEVAVRVAHPAAFLHHGVSRLDVRLERLGSDGTLVLLYEPDGRLLSVQGGSLRLHSGEGGVVDPRYRSCVANRLLTQVRGPEPPCPAR